VEDAHNDDQLSNDSGCQDIATDVDGNGEYNTIALQTFKSNQRLSVDATYNHIALGPKSAITIDNTYAHIPNSATGSDNTYSHMFNQNNRPEQENENESVNSTYNHLGETIALSSLSRHNEDGQFGAQSNNGQTDDTYSHINENNNKSHIQNPKTDYEDTTYNHIGDIPTATKRISYGKGSETGQSSNGVTKTQTPVASRYDYAMVNKRLQPAKTTVDVDDAPHDYLVLESDQTTAGKPNPYDYAVVNTTPCVPWATSPTDNGSHIDEPKKRFALAQSKATKPKPYDYAVVNKMSLASEATASPEYGPHENYVLEPIHSNTTKR